MRVFAQRREGVTAVSVMVMVALILCMSGGVQSRTQDSFTEYFVDGVNGTDTNNTCTVEKKPCQTMYHCYDEIPSDVDSPVINVGSNGVVMNQGLLFINRSLTVEGANSQTTIDGAGGSNGFVVNGTTQVSVNFRQIVFQNFDATSSTNSCGAVVDVQGNGNFSAQAAFINNKAPNGGAICLSGGGAVSINSSLFENNTATISDGGAVATSPSFAPNESAGFMISGAVFLTNTAKGSGGALSIQPTTILFLEEFAILNCVFQGNQAGENGGGVIITTINGANSGSLTQTQNNFTGNQAGSIGGGLYQTSSSLDWVGTLFAENSATSGSAVFLGASAGAWSQTTVANNDAVTMAAMYVDDSSTTFSNTTVQDNAVTSGTYAGLYCFNSDGSWDDSYFSGNIINTTDVTTASMRKYGVTTEFGRFEDAMLFSSNSNSSGNDTEVLDLSPTLITYNCTYFQSCPDVAHNASLSDSTSCGPNAALIANQSPGSNMTNLTCVMYDGLCPSSSSSGSAFHLSAKWILIATGILVAVLLLIFMVAAMARGGSSEDDRSVVSGESEYEPINQHQRDPRYV
eukprot:TRINITY_DN9139_c0_g1_i1.p1 TRINITY_DN9139_c0_g1~~TRINITY_DN9139_c0_g1_i1.p1  ORF type:complete len:572 (+),score=108.13 TRINITY_DN9139_c0_g1_i1:90-1805(+)